MLRQKYSKEDLINIYKSILNKYIKNNESALLSRDIFFYYVKKEGLAISKDLINKLFGSYTNFKKQAMQSSSDIENKSIEKDDKNSFSQMSEYYDYNDSTGEYRFNFLDFKNIGKLITLPRYQVYAILQAYSGYDGNKYSIREISDIHKLSPYVVKAILKVLNFTHDDLPITNEDVTKKTEAQCIEDLLDTVKGNIHNEFQKRLWDDQIRKAKNWDLFEARQLNPYESIIKNWSPPLYKQPDIKRLQPFDNTGETYVVTISDLHFGLKTDSSDTYWSNKDWDTYSTTHAIEKYVESIDNDLSHRMNIPRKCVLMSLGDILHSISGFTTKGTELETDTKGPQQFKAALDSLSYLISYLSNKFKFLEIKAVSGNHDYFGDWVLFATLEKYFTPANNISWKVCTERWCSFTLGSNLILMEHGYSPFYKSKVPKAVSAKEAYVHRLITKETQTLAAQGKVIKNNYFFMGDLHHFTSKDFPMFEFIQLPTCVSSDKYADHLNLAGTRNKQLTFIMDNDLGIKSIVNHYLD